jgi:hypothetical protein
MFELSIQNQGPANFPTTPTIPCCTMHTCSPRSKALYQDYFSAHMPLTPRFALDLLRHSGHTTLLLQSLHAIQDILVVSPQDALLKEGWGEPVPLCAVMSLTLACKQKAFCNCLLTEASSECGRLRTVPFSAKVVFPAGGLVLEELQIPSVSSSIHSLNTCPVLLCISYDGAGRALHTGVGLSAEVKPGFCCRLCAWHSCVSTEEQKEALF